MGLQVPLDLVGAAETLPAHGAAVGLLARVDPHVHLEVGHLREPFAADLAAEGLLARVAARVLLQPARRRAALPAHAAAVRLLPRVHLHVHMQVAHVAEGLAAHLAAERRRHDVVGGGARRDLQRRRRRRLLVRELHRGVLLLLLARAHVVRAAAGSPSSSGLAPAVLHADNVNVVLVGAVGVDRSQRLRSRVVGRRRASSVPRPSSFAFRVSGRASGRAAAGRRVPPSSPPLAPVLLLLGEVGGVGLPRRHRALLVRVAVGHAGRREHGVRRAALSPAPSELLLLVAAGAELPLVLDLQGQTLLVAHAGAPLAPGMLAALLLLQHHGRTV